MTDKENKWIKFYPSLELPKERVSIAYDTHDERGVRYAYGYFQFYNGTCGCFWKDGNEQPKVVKAEDIKYWMPVPSLDVQEEPASDLEEASRNYADNEEYGDDVYFAIKAAFKVGAKWQLRKTRYEKDYTDLCNGTATAKGIAVTMAYEKGVADTKVQMMKNIWKPADGDDLPEIDREVIVLIKYNTQRNIHDKEYSTYKVGFGHRPNPDGWDGKNIDTNEVARYTPKLYDKGGWNAPDIVYWLDIELPKEIEL